MQVLSRLPGRLRAGGLLGTSPNHAPTLAHQLEDELEVLSGIRRARADPLTGNILVLYDPLRYSEAEIQALLLQLLGHLHANGDDLHHHHDHEKCGHHHETNMTAAVSRLVLGGVVLAEMLVRRLVRGRPPVVGGAIANLSGVMAIVTGYPFFRSAFRSLSGREKLTTDTLISVATIASIVMRESITGLIVIWLLNLGELLQMLTLRRTRRAIEELPALVMADVGIAMGPPDRTWRSRPRTSPWPGATSARSPL
jgi:cation-transporting P-type ATPase C